MNGTPSVVNIVECEVMIGLVIFLELVSKEFVQLLASKSLGNRDERI